MAHNNKPLTDLLKICSLDQSYCTNQTDHCLIRGLAIDSRVVKAGDLFMAYPGSQVDGRQFIVQAIQNGAQAVLVEAESFTPKSYDTAAPILPVKGLREKVGLIAAHFYNYPSKALTVIGVTGTNGKTSCVHLTANALNQLGYPCATLGTLGVILPDGSQLQKLPLTTPDPLTLQHTFSRLVDQKISYVAMEISSHAIDQARIAGTDIDYALLTNLSRDHLDYHKTFEAYTSVKLQLLTQYTRKAAIINMDDTTVYDLTQTLKGQIALRGFSLTPSPVHKHHPGCNKVVLGEADPTVLPELSIKLTHTTGETGRINSRLLGTINASNILAVLSVLLELNIPWQSSLTALSALTPVEGRLERCQLDEDKQMAHQAWIVIDYAHTPDALLRVLKDLRYNCPGKLWCVFGCGGNRDQGKRQEMGKIAECYSDHVIITNDNPRDEVPSVIAQAILAGFSHPEAAVILYDREQAIHHALTHAGPEDRILIAGKGHESHQVIAGHRLPFKDAEVVYRLLKAHSKMCH